MEKERKFRMYLISGITGDKTRSRDYPGEYTEKEIFNISDNTPNWPNYEIREVVTEERVVQIKETVTRSLV